MPTRCRLLILLVFWFTNLSAAVPAAAVDPETPTGSAIYIKFSVAGFAGGESLPPTIPAKFQVHATGNDDTALLQAAIDELAARPAQSDGYRGAILLAPGMFHIAGQLLIPTGGIVLRGSANHATTLLATGRSRRTLIEVGRHQAPTTAPAIQVTDETVLVGANRLTLESVASLKASDEVSVIRPCTEQWIADLGMKGFPGLYASSRIDWTPGSRTITWYRTITGIDPAKNQITIDAPITTALERRYGGGIVSKIIAPEKEIPRLIGIEDLVLDSSFDPQNPCDEEHAWIAVAFHTVKDAWVRNVTARHFVGSAVRVGPHARRVTIDSCRSEEPISEHGGYRRQSFLVEGQQTVVEHCFAEAGMNDFGVGLCAAGPDVFFDCSTKGSIGDSGSFESWASGVLYENVRIDGAGLRLTYEMVRAQGGGWTAANCIVYNCKARSFDIKGPDSAPNAQIISDKPLYTPPAVAVSAAPAEEKSLPVLSTVTTVSTRPAPASQPPLQIINGHFVIGTTTLWGGSVNDAWWHGQANPDVHYTHGLSIIRFVPGRDGPGLTENLPDLAARMVADNTPFYQSGAPLWYDRHRDEHTIVQRTTPDVWAPFLEMPWARSGQITSQITAAWDGLSRYDLTKYNPWYFDRVHTFADLCQQDGLLLYHSLYNTHNVMEIPPHWADFPWRPANNINETALPEPPPIEPGSRIHLGNQFYNVDAPSARKLHHAYIFHVLDELGTCPNIVFGVAYQFPGPLAFQQFFLDTVADWEHQTGRTVRVELATTKDITDAILTDPVRSKMISVVDMRYWQYRPDGSLWAPPGGQNHAVREYVHKDFGVVTDFPPATTPPQLYRQVREYHDKYPDKAIVAYHGGVGPVPIVMAGGAQCLNRNPTAGHDQNRIDRAPLDPVIQKHLSPLLMNLTPRDGLLASAATTWCLATERDQTLVIYSLEGKGITFTQPLTESYAAQWLNPRTGETQPLPERITPSMQTTIPKPTAEDWFLLLQSEH